jgi:hypothetical protein
MVTGMFMWRRGCQYYLRLVCLSVHPHETTRLPLDGFSWNLIFAYFFENLSRKFEFHLNLTRITGTLHRDQYKFLILHRSFLLRIRNVSDKRCKENQSAHFIFSKFIFFFFENLAVNETMCKHTVQPGRPMMIIWRKRITCCIPNDTNTHLEYVMHIAFPLQQLLHARASTPLKSTLSLLFVACYFKLVLGAVTVGVNLGCCHALNHVHWKCLMYRPARWGAYCGSGKTCVNMWLVSVWWHNSVYRRRKKAVNDVSELSKTKFRFFLYTSLRYVWEV